MSDIIPEEPPTPEEPAACAYPLLTPYRNERQARVVAGIGSLSRYPWECPAGHWHVLRRTSGDEVRPPVPAPTEPPVAPTAPRRPMQRRRR